MFRLLSRSRRLAALLAAGVLGIAPLAAAPVPPPAAARAVTANRLQEIQVELAWMADPMTFRCPLHVHATAGGLEVNGFVPKAAVRARALKIAHDACGKSVRDTITVNPAAEDSFAPASSAAVLRGVNHAVAEALGRRAHTAEVGMGEKGKVFLRGQGLSWEDRYAASARLRLVEGCSCVVNVIEPADSRARSAATPRPMPSVTAKPLPTPRTATGSATAGTIQRTSWVSPYTTQSEPPTEAYPSAYSSKPTVAPVSNSFASPYGSSKSPETAANSRSLRSSATRPSLRVASAAHPEAGSSISEEESEILSSEPADMSSVEVKPSAPRGLFARFRRERPVESMPMPMPMPLERASIPVHPYVTMGTAIFYDEEPELIPAGAKTSQVSTDALRHRVLLVCGTSVENVAIKPRADGGTEVTLRVRSENMIDMLFGKVQQLSEMRSPQMHLSFEVMP